MSNTKQVIVVRADLKMRRGKEAAQVAHASMMFMTKRLVLIPHEYANNGLYLSPTEEEWLDNSFTKICLAVDSEAELADVYQSAQDAGVEAHLCRDNGTTEFGGVPTYTCAALGPDLSTKIDGITGHLRLR